VFGALDLLLVVVEVLGPIQMLPSASQYSRSLRRQLGEDLRSLAKLAPVSSARIKRSQAVTTVSRRQAPAATKPLNPAQPWGKPLRKAKDLGAAREARLSALKVFKTSAFNRSATLPECRFGRLVGQGASRPPINRRALSLASLRALAESSAAEMQ
jgi:hypothetical protein